MQRHKVDYRTPQTPSKPRFDNVGLIAGGIPMAVTGILSGVAFFGHAVGNMFGINILAVGVCLILAVTGIFLIVIGSVRLSRERRS